MQKSNWVRLIVGFVSSSLLLQGQIGGFQRMGINSQNFRPQTASPTATSAQSAPMLALLLLDSSTSADLYTLDVDSLSLQRIVQNIAPVIPAWSPDHKHIVFAQATLAGDIQITIMNINSLDRYPIYTIPHRILAGLDRPIYRIIWSSDGKWLAFDLMVNYPSEESYIYIIDTKGSFIKAFGPSDLKFFVERWLPDNNEFAYVLHNGTCNAIYVQNIFDMLSENRFLVGCTMSDEPSTPTSTRTNCLIDSGNLFAVAWSSNARYLAVTLELPFPPCPDIILMEPGTSHISTLPFSADELAWSPDNKTIAYQEDSINDRLCIVDTSGTNNRCDAAIEGDLSQIAWQSTNIITSVAVDHDYYKSQICVTAVDTFKKRCLVEILPGSVVLIQ